MKHEGFGGKAVWCSDLFGIPVSFCATFSLINSGYYVASLHVLTPEGAGLGHRLHIIVHITCFRWVSLVSSNHLATEVKGRHTSILGSVACGCLCWLLDW